jgi:hypothetical protein
MLGDLDSGDDIAEAAEDLLGRADAAGRWPTPVDDIVAAAARSRSPRSRR